MSAAKSTKRAAAPAQPAAEVGSGFQPWHLFLIMTMLATAAAAVAVRGTSPSNVIFVCLTVASAGFAAYAAYLALRPLADPDAAESPEMLGGRPRAALEREKALLLRAIAELEFDRAMGKVCEADWQEMTARLRARAVRVAGQLDRGGEAYREVIERELAAREAAAAAPPRTGGAGRPVASLILAAAVLGSLWSASPARAQMPPAGAAGTLSIGGQSRIVAEFQDEQLQVYYLFDLVNAGPSPVATAGPLVFALPAEAQNPGLLEGSTPNAAIQGGTVVVSGPFPPGVTRVMAAYGVPQDASFALRQKLPVAMDQVAVMVEKLGSVVVSSPQLSMIREGTAGGRPFVIGTGAGLRAGDVLTIDIGGLPHPATWPRDTALALAALTLAAGVWGASRLGGQSAASVARQRLEARREHVFGELAGLDARIRSGQASAAQAGDRRGQLVVELERIYGELDTGAPASAAGPGRPA